MFERFASRVVSIKSRDGIIYQVPFLPIRAIDRFAAISESLAQAPAMEQMLEARRQLAELAMMRCPEDLRQDLEETSCDGLFTVVTALFYGEGAGKPATAAARIEMDFEFIAARLAGIFPGYTIDTLLELPVPVFMKLYELSGRVQADRALNEMLPAASIAVGGDRDSLSLLTRFRDGGERQKASARRYSQQDIDAAKARLCDAERKVISRVTVHDLG